MHYFSFHIKDYQMATSHLTVIEDCCYRRLLDLYYDTELPLSLDAAGIARRIRMDEETVSAILTEFFERTPEGWSSARANAEIAGFQAMKSGGKRGADKRWHRGANGAGNGGAMATLNTPQCQPVTSNHEPVTKNQTKSKDAPKPSDDPLDFIWSVGTQILGDKARPLIGQARKAVGDQKVTEVLAYLVSAKPPISDPLPYFIKATKPVVRGLVL